MKGYFNRPLALSILPPFKETAPLGNFGVPVLHQFEVMEQTRLRLTNLGRVCKPRLSKYERRGAGRDLPSLPADDLAANDTLRRSVAFAFGLEQNLLGHSQFSLVSKSIGKAITHVMNLP
jgi:hypothetical protein